MVSELTDTQNKLVLIADDDARIRQFLDMAIREVEGFQVAMATNGPETIEKICEKKPDLIILDLMMPGFGGFEILRKLREGPASSTPIIIVTARYMDEATQQVVRSEANVKEFVFKPISLPLIQEAIHRALGRPPSGPQGHSIQ